ncbi:hypothetical protein C2845_PM03G37110 [Panicum miliaceum]|uniref:Uncharacterized protein n=1 Tax=Panicum miliaceum TaxID=4540 RepID=A0A3L6TG03_PANMI|nr:hypothetical protein C2845_PM03G37110 [Panicum miliaceum]
MAPRHNCTHTRLARSDETQAHGHGRWYWPWCLRCFQEAKKSPSIPLAANWPMARRRPPEQRGRSQAARARRRGDPSALDEESMACWHVFCLTSDVATAASPHDEQPADLLRFGGTRSLAGASGPTPQAARTWPRARAPPRLLQIALAPLLHIAVCGLCGGGKWEQQEDKVLVRCV